jgi:translation initiation factor eIF-2B subunit delta
MYILAMEAFAKAGGVPPKREKLSKQERRALQEKQRAEKEITDENTPSTISVTTTAAPVVPPRLQYDDAKKMAKRSKGSVVVRTQAQKHVPLFSHLPQYERESSLHVGLSSSIIHPSILSLGLQFAEGKITGGNARCIAMLTAFKQVIQEYNTPPNKIFTRDLDKTLRPLIQYLIDCRPHCIGMGNAIRSVRHLIGTTMTYDEKEAKQHILNEIEEYIQGRILLANQVITKTASTKITKGDVILTYARSNVIENIFKQAAKEQKSFRVIVVDSRPHYEGKQLIQALTKIGIACTYLQINALSYIMRDVTKVFLGASAFMSNGVAIGRVGTALVAMSAHEKNIPVLFCCETYKFSDRVQLDSITHNELRDPDELVSSYCTSRRTKTTTTMTTRKTHVLSDWRDLPNLKLLNLAYDVTPTEYVTLIVTELGMIPPTSIPAILRQYSKEGLLLE